MKTLAIISTDKTTDKKSVEHLVPSGMPLMSARAFTERTYKSFSGKKTVALVYGTYDATTDSMLKPYNILMVLT